MMKKILLILTFAFLAVFASEAQTVTKTEKYMLEYVQFVKSIVTMPFADFHGDTLKQVDRMQDKFMRRYRWYYKKRMSIDQLEEFNKWRGRYNRKMTALSNRRRWAATKGRIEGFFERLDSASFAPAKAEE